MKLAWLVTATIGGVVILYMNAKDLYDYVSGKDQEEVAE
jgi:hypothetical protein